MDTGYRPVVLRPVHLVLHISMAHRLKSNKTFNLWWEMYASRPVIERTNLDPNVRQAVNHFEFNDALVSKKVGALNLHACYSSSSPYPSPVANCMFCSAGLIFSAVFTEIRLQYSCRKGMRTSVDMGHCVAALYPPVEHLAEDCRRFSRPPAPHLFVQPLVVFAGLVEKPPRVLRLLRGVPRHLRRAADLLPLGGLSPICYPREGRQAAFRRQRRRRFVRRRRRRRRRRGRRGRRRRGRRPDRVS